VTEGGYPWQAERARIHGNARTRRKKWCESCGRAVPETDHSWKFAAAGGVLAGPFCSESCYWRFVRDDWNDTDTHDRRRVYLYGDDEPPATGDEFLRQLFAGFGGESA
jgi:hypothetical protein